MKDSRPIIIAICGKSAVGKDTLSNWLQGLLKSENIPSKEIISDTTRPKRVGEIDGEDYHFLSSAEFLRNKVDEKYLEDTSFNGWRYGTRKEEINSEKINIGVFNPSGIREILRYKEEFRIVIIYLTNNPCRRLRRSIEREHRFSFEMIRRMWVDYKDFKDIDFLLEQHSDVLRLRTEHVNNNAKRIEFFLKNENII